MKNIVLLSMLSVFFTSCVSLNGDLTVSEKMTVKKKSGFLNLGRKNIEIQPGSYDARLTALGKNDFALILNRGEERLSIPLTSKKELSLPKYDGDFKISGSDIEQGFDVAGNLQTDMSRSDTQMTIESCTWNTRETRCGIECHEEVTKDSQGVERRENRCEKVCRDYTITHQGRHEVIFHYLTTDRALRLELLKLGSETSLAHFQGTSHEVDRIVEREGICN